MFQHGLEVAERNNLILWKFRRTTTTFSYAPELLALPGRMLQKELCSQHGRKLQLEAVTQTEFEVFIPEEEVLDRIVYVEQSMGLEVGEEDIKVLVTTLSQELTTDEFAQQQM